MSKHQYGALRFIRTHNVTMQMARRYRDVTIWSCARRGWIAREGRGQDAVLICTPEGDAAFREYSTATIPERKYEVDLTDRFMHELKLARVLQFQKSA